MQLEELSNISDSLAMMLDPALQQFAQMHKNDPYMVSLALSESNRRKKLRTAAQGQAGSVPQPKVVDAAIQGMAPAPVMTGAGVPLQTGYGGPVMTGMASGGLPEDQGIAQLPAPNMQAMADGGIAGYGDGDDVPRQNGMAQGGMYDFAQRSEPVLRMAGGGMTGYMPEFKNTGAVNAAFEAALEKTLKYEGGYVADDAGKGPSNFGINKSANPDVDIKNLTKDKARELYKKRYWDAIGGDALAAKDPALATVAFDTAVNMGVNKAKQLVEQSKGDPAAILSMRQQHYDKLIENDPKKFTPFKAGWQSRLADLATSVIPSAQAGEIPKAAPKDLVSQIPGSKVAPPAPGQKDRYITGNQGVIGAGETALQYLTGALAVPTAGGAAMLEQVPNLLSGRGADRAEMEKSYREKAGQVTYEPRTEGGKAVSEGFAKTLEDLKIPSYMARVGAGTPKGPAARPSAEGIAGIAEQMKQAAAEQKAKVSNIRLENKTGEKPTLISNAEGTDVMPEKTRASVASAFDDLNAAEKAARDAAAYEKAAIEAKNAPDFSKYAGAMDEGQLEAARARGISALVGVTPASISTQKSAADAAAVAAMPTENQSAAETARLLRQNELPPPKDIVEAAKEATPAKERKGFGDDDLLMLGLSLMANKSPNFMTALGEAGIQTLGAKREREKGETEKLYRDALIEQAKRPSSEVQLIEKYRDDSKFAAAYDKFVQSKREPQTRESLLKSWGASPFLQMTYTNPEDYIKMMSAAASGGAPGSQLNASDQSLIQKYLR
jgi:lysozyme family protein